jgi:hypothetical protein
MADMYGYQDTGSRIHAANGWLDAGKNDLAVGSGSRDTGVGKYNRDHQTVIEIHFKSQNMPVRGGLQKEASPLTFSYLVLGSG